MQNTLILDLYKLKNNVFSVKEIALKTQRKEVISMPNKDGKGPKGKGPKDGHGRGKGKGTNKPAGPKKGGEKGGC